MQSMVKAMVGQDEDVNGATSSYINERLSCIGFYVYFILNIELFHNMNFIDFLVQRKKQFRKDFLFCGNHI